MGHALAGTTIHIPNLSQLKLKSPAKYGLTILRCQVGMRSTIRRINRGQVSAFGIPETPGGNWHYFNENFDTAVVRDDNTTFYGYSNYPNAYLDSQYIWDWGCPY